MSKFLSVTYCTLLSTIWLALAQSTIAAQLSSDSQLAHSTNGDQTAQIDRVGARPGIPGRRVGGGSR